MDMQMSIVTFAAFAAMLVIVRVSLRIILSRQGRWIIGAIRERRENRRALGLLRTMRNVDLQLTRVAFHEAGHALMSWRSPYSRRGIDVFIINRKQGYVRHGWNPDKLRMIDVMRDVLTVYVAGAAAESLRFRHTDRENLASGCSDLRNAIAAAKELLYLREMHPADQESHDATPLPSTEKDDGFEKYLTSCHEEDVSTAVKELLRRAYVDARVVLKANAAKLDTLAAIALYRRKLTGVRIRRLLGNRPALKHTR